jgi:tetratricopeptide (TPR) repeat protein
MLAYHYSKSEESEKAMYYLEMARDKAAYNYSLLDARTYYSDAMELIDSASNNKRSKPDRTESQADRNQSQVGTNFTICRGRYNFNCRKFAGFCQGVERQAQDRSSYLLARSEKLCFGNFKKAIENFSNCIELAELSNEKTLLAKAYPSIGRMYFYEAEYKKAKQLLEKSIPVLEELGEQEEVAYLTVFLGWPYAFTGDFEKAFGNVEKGKKIIEETGI